MPRPDAPSFTGPELCALSACEAVDRLRAGELSPAELLDASAERLAQVEPTINATPITCVDRARTQLDSLPALAEQHGEDLGWLAGLPIGIKDLNMVGGVRCTYGNLGMADFVPETSEPLVERLEARGAVVMGKTNTPEFGAGGNTFNAVFGYTRNPWDTRRNAGGSSGGAAASLASGEVWLSHGSDLAGSLRTPAGYCGVVGLRPSPGRAGGGPGPAAFLLEGISGPMARNVADVALFLDAMSGFDPRMPMSIDAPATPFRDATRHPDPQGLRIAFSEDQNGFAPVEAEIRAVMRAAMAQLDAAGAAVADACPELPGLEATYVTLRGLHYASVNAATPPEIQRHFKRTLRENTESGLAMSAAQIFEAQRQRTVLYQAMRVFLDDFDVLALPVVGLEPGPVEEEYPRVVDGVEVDDYVHWLRFSFLATTTALPSLALPVGFTASGMPVGMQLIGPPRGEAKLLRVAAAVEAVLGFPTVPIDPQTGTAPLRAVTEPALPA